MDAAAFEQVYGAFGDFHAYFAPLFGRRETREHSGHYLQALLVQSGERRNAENLSETVPGSARGMQRFLTDSPWDDEAIIGRLQEYLGTRLEHPEGVWVLDGSDFPKQGRKSAGVARQYCGRLGKVANCQAGMFLAYVSPLGRALVDKRLYLPESWTSDKDRCEAAGVPEDRQGYRSKTELALEMVGRAPGAGPPEGWMGRCGRCLRYVAVIPRRPGGLGDVVRAGRSVRLYGVAAGACLDQCGVSGIRASPQAEGSAAGSRRTMAERRFHHGGGVASSEGSQGPRSLCPEGASARRNPLRRNLDGANPATICPMPGADPGLRGRIPLAHRNGVRDGEKRRGAGRVRDPHLGWLASPCGPVPARSLSLQQAWGEKDPGSEAAGLPGGAGNLPRERFGPEELLRWLEDTQDSNERARRSHAKRRAAMRASPHIPP